MTLLTHDLSSFKAPNLPQGVLEAAVQGLLDQKVPALVITQQEDDLAHFEAQSSFLTGFKTLVVLGTGGSSLGAKSLLELTRPVFGWQERQMVFVENVDPHTVDALLSTFDPQETGYIVISKSGSTAETMSQFLCVLAKLRARVGEDNLAKHCLVITQETDSPLKRLAQRLHLPTLDHPCDIGGRFSVFSCVGLVPALLMGVDVKALRRGAASLLKELEALGAKSPVAQGASVCASLSQRGHSAHVMMPYCDRLGVYTLWWRQLWAESLGKKGQGTLPVPASGTVDQHSQLQLFLEGPRDKFYTLLLSRAQGHGPAFDARDVDTDPALSYFTGRTMGDLLVAEQKATLMCLRNQNLPVRTVTFDTFDAQTLGALLMQGMIETLLVARLMGVNAFDQDAVEESKILTRRFMQQKDLVA